MEEKEAVINDIKEECKMSNEEIEEANRREIERLMNEDAN